MDIQKIEIKNFKGIKDMTYEPNGTVNVLLGENGYGKTSFLQALEFVLTGKHKDRKNISYGEKQSVVSIMINHKVFTKIMDNEENFVNKVNGTPCTLRDYEGFLQEELGVNIDDLKILISSRLFNEISSQGLSDFISSHLPEKISFDKLTKALGKDFPDDSLFFLEEKLGDTFYPQEFLALYDDFYITRRNYNRTLKECKAKISKKLEKPVFSEDDLNREKETIAQIEAEIKANAKIKKTYDDAIRMYEKQVSQKEQLKKMIAESKCEKPKMKDYNAAQKRLKDLQEIIANSKSMIKTLKDNNNLYQSTLDKLNTTICPISRKLICSTDKTPLKEEFLEAIKLNNKAILSNETNIVQNQSEIQDIEKYLTDFSKKQVAYERYNTLKEQEKACIISEKPEKPDIKEYDIEAVSERKKVLSEDLKELLRYQQYEKDQAEYEKVRKICLTYDYLVKATKADGEIVKKILEDYFEIFNNICNETAVKLHSKFSIYFEFDKGIKCICKKEDKKRSFDNLSDGEKTIVSFILIDMLNQLAGNKILFIDNLNELDGEAVFNLFAMLNCYKTNYDSIFMASIDYEEILSALDMIEAERVFEK